MKRKIVQISVSDVPNTATLQANIVYLALCDDGTVWEAFDTRPEWQRLFTIPQDDETPYMEVKP